MCGISGFSGKINKADPMESMLDTLKHRGPDDQGFLYFKDNTLGLGNNRLAIIDLSQNGHQPMSDISGRYTIVFNGEIYNFEEVRGKLGNKYIYKSKSDTEVILYSYIEWGIHCLDNLNGMFAFVIYDRETDTLFGARDRLGEKPLKYYYDGSTLIFASEIKAILSVMNTKPEMDPIAINHYLSFQYVPAPYTGFKNIFKLPPAHYFIYKNSKLEVQKYWNLDVSEKDILTEKDWQAQILEDLEKSVKMRLVSDVPIGALLSGGVDSSAVVAYMAKNISGRVKTFSIGFDSKEFDETAYAKTVSDLYNTEHTFFRMNSGMITDLIPKVAQYYDEPFADNSLIPTYIVTKMAREHVTVALNGDGGDENFAGYDRYNIVVTGNKYKFLGNDLFKAGSKIVDSIVKSKFSERLARFTSTLHEPFNSRYLNYSSFFTNGIKYGLYSPDFMNTVKGEDSFKYFNKFNTDDINSDLDLALILDINTYLPEDLLFKTDIASMANSLELRAPLLDYKFMEKMARIPTNLKINNGELKYIFKKALVENNILPTEVVYRKKRGFNIPLNKWLKHELKDYVNDSIKNGHLSSVGIFDQIKLEKYTDEYFTTNRNYDNNIFALLMLNQWFERYIK